MKITKKNVDNVLEGIGNLIIIGAKAAIPIMITSLAGKFSNKIGCAIEYSGTVTYNDAIKAINDSSMFSSDVQTVISNLETGRDSEFYRSVIYVANSKMFSSDKVKTILNMNKNKKEEEE